jgi:tetratricopeptide (TPR) repeat protein
MIRAILQLLYGDSGPVGLIFVLLTGGFCVWMFVHAVRRGEYLWAGLIFCFSIFTAVCYYIFVYRNSEPLGNPFAGFELPGAADRRRIKELEAGIHHLDRAHLHQELGDIYFNQGKFAQAEASFRAAYQRDPKDEDTRAHLGTCLAQRGKAAEALPLLQDVVAEDPKHDYGYTLMALAEAQEATGAIEAALATWRQVLSLYAYPRARVQFAELLIRQKQYAEARTALEEVVNDQPHATKFEQKREKAWFNRAKSALRSLPG